MKNEIILIDYENLHRIPDVDFKNISKLIIILGADQNRIPVETVCKSQEYGKRIMWLKVGARGKNALDFFITYYLGYYSAKYPSRVFKVFSKDRGYDPLINHLQQAKINVTLLYD